MKKALWFLLLLSLLASAAACRKQPAGSEPAPESAPAEPAVQTEQTPADTDPQGDVPDPADMTAEDMPESAEEIRLEAIPTQSGRHAVSDGEFLYFTIHSADETAGMWKEGDGLFRATLSMEDPVLLVHGNCRSLVLDGELLYFYLEDAGGRSSICSVDKQGTQVRRIVPDVEASDSLGMWNGKLFFVQQNGGLCIVDDMESGSYTPFAPEHHKVLQACPAPENRIWLSAVDNRNLSVSLFIYDPADGSCWGIFPMLGNFAVGEDGVYCLIRVPDQPEYPDYRQYNYALMRVDEHFDPVFTGIEGRLDGTLLPYGPYLLYAKYTQVEEKANLGETSARKLFCYDTRTGTETALPRDEFIGIDISLRAVSNGWLFYNAYDYYASDPESVEFCDCRCCDLSGGHPQIVLGSLIPEADSSAASLAYDLSTQEFMEARRQEEEEALRNTPYGPGISYLYLKAGDKSACFRLVRMDGTLQFQVLLAPGEETTQSFPCGKYILKTAYGDTWISDDEAFGSDGRYSATDPFTFESNASYEISTGTHGDFHGDSQAGFTG
ncbi:MAG: hypothetical protein J6P31_03500 [Oscillospiraceae bacterium]|nr:hypothetical protein [Oscillospiraceae bacterium]